MEVLGELDQDRRQSLEGRSVESQRVVGQALLRLGERLHDRVLNLGEVLLHRAFVALGAKRKFGHRFLVPSPVRTEPILGCPSAYRTGTGSLNPGSATVAPSAGRRGIRIGLFVDRNVDLDRRAEEERSSTWAAGVAWRSHHCSC